MKILCVEDGSVDIDKLEQEGLKDGGIILYRQGSKPPYVVDMCSDESVFKIKLNSLYGKNTMNEPSGVREHKIDKLQEWVEDEIEQVEVLIDPCAEEYERLCGVLSTFKRVLQKIKELKEDL